VKDKSSGLKRLPAQVRVIYIYVSISILDLEYLNDHLRPFHIGLSGAKREYGSGAWTECTKQCSGFRLFGP
jgi:hypothetical protein